MNLDVNEEEKKETPKSNDKYWVLGLLFALALSLIGDFVLLKKLETERINNAVLTKEIRRFENKNYEEIRKDLSLLEEVRSALVECEQMNKEKP